MAKALFGHVGSMNAPDPRTVSEMRRLQQRVRDLESMVQRLQTENDALARLVRLDSDETLLVVDAEQHEFV